MTQYLNIEVTGNKRTDYLLSGVAGCVELLFPDRVRASYLTGSQARGLDTPNSDFDIFIFFKDYLRPEEKEKTWELMVYLWMVGYRDLDLKFHGEGQFYRLGYPFFKDPSPLIHGDEIRPIQKERQKTVGADIFRYSLHLAANHSARIRGNPHTLTYPLRFPNPDTAFKGYADRPIHDQSGDLVPGARELLNVTLKPAAALIAIETRELVLKKPDCARLYGRHIDPDWADYLDRIETLCRREWGGIVPESDKDKERLQNLCDRALAFENHFFERYRALLLQELHDSENQRMTLSLIDADLVLSGIPERVLSELAESGGIGFEEDYGERVYAVEHFNQIMALSTLGRFLFPDDEVRAAVEKWTHHGNPVARETAVRVLGRLEREPGEEART